jgi:hypothetical protein
MAKCSIPNSSPANGRISTRSLGRSKRRNNQRTASIRVISRCCSVQKRRHGAARQSALHARESWTLDVGRWVFFPIRRVKGAWWPSRSSKPSSLRKWRGRFDSYPLRHFVSDFRFLIFDCTIATALWAVQEPRGGEPHVA